MVDVQQRWGRRQLQALETALTARGAEKRPESTRRRWGKGGRGLAGRALASELHGEERGCGGAALPHSVLRLQGWPGCSCPSSIKLPKGLKACRWESWFPLYQHNPPTAACLPGDAVILGHSLHGKRLDVWGGDSRGRPGELDTHRHDASHGLGVHMGTCTSHLQPPLSLLVKGVGVARGQGGRDGSQVWQQDELSFWDISGSEEGLGSLASSHQVAKGDLIEAAPEVPSCYH